VNWWFQYKADLTEDRIKGELRLIELAGEENNRLIQRDREYQRALAAPSPAELLGELAVQALGE